MNKDHPNIQVKATKFDGAAQDMIKKLETDVKAGNAPDLAQVATPKCHEVFDQWLARERDRRGREVQKRLRRRPIFHDAG